MNNNNIKGQFTINLQKRTHKIQFKLRAPRALKEIRSFAAKTMGTKDVRIDTTLNKQCWINGVRSPPRYFLFLLHFEFCIFAFLNFIF